jgi:transposase-like protein
VSDVLKPKMMRAAEILVAEPEKPLGDIAKELGVNDSTLWRWRRMDEFKEYEHELCMERFKDLEKLAIYKLKENARNNNQKAIEYILDYVGYKAEDKSSVQMDAKIEIDYGED